MLSARLVKMIEDHAEVLTGRVLDDLVSNRRTPTYHRIPHAELHRRAFDVYHNLGQWLLGKPDSAIEAAYGLLGKTRYLESIPLSEVVFALTLTKQHLWDYVRSSGLAESAVELYQEEELNLLVGQFFDKAVYYTVKGYEGAQESRTMTAAG